MKKLEYVLLVLSEEGVEVSHAAHKVLRFTKDDSHTIGGPTNYEKLVEEYNDFLGTVELLNEMGFELPVLRDRIDRKKRRIAEYMNYSRLIGVVKDE